MSEIGILESMLRPVVSLLPDLINLDRNAEVLGMEVEELKLMREDVESMAAASRRLTSSVKAWMESVESLTVEVDHFQRDLDRSGTGCHCGLASFGLARRATYNLKRARELKDARGKLRGFLGGAVWDSRLLIGRERRLSAIRDYLEDDDVGVIGIYGMAGVGKTTLLKRINNEVVAAGRACAFDAVIWVTVGTNVDILRIQDSIGARLGLDFSADRGSSSPERYVYERAQVLRKSLRKRRFLLLLDDVWEVLDLVTIGIPLPSDQWRSKIAFTTRSFEVCCRMQAEVLVRVSPLDKGESWKLFRATVGARVDLKNPSISRIAEHIVDRCGGLPVALVTVGRALADATTVNEWENAWFRLRQSPEEFRDMDDVLSVLKFNFDRLERDIHRQCLLYCFLFPHEHGIHIEQLVDYWVGEGLLDDPMLCSPEKGAFCH